MPSFLKTSPIWSDINPKNSIPLDRLESDTHMLLIPVFCTLQELTPPAPSRLWHPNPREIGASTFTLSIHIHIEGTNAICRPICSTPIIVMRVMASCEISLSP